MNNASQINKPAIETVVSLGKALHSARLAKGYSLEQLAIVTGLTEAELRGIEVGGGDLSMNRLDRVWLALR